MLQLRLTRAPAVRVMATRASSTPTKRPRVVDGHWDNRGNRVHFMEGLATALGVEKLEDWKNVGREQVRERGGGGLLAKFDNSMHRLLADVFPHRSPLEAASCRPRRPQGYWGVAENRRRFLEEVRKEEAIGEAREWCKVTTRDIRRHGGQALLNYHNGSLRAALAEAFPLEDWDSVLSGGMGRSKRHWDSLANQRSFLEDVARRHGVRRPEEWRRVRREAIVSAGGSALLAKHASVFDALSTVFPEHEWNRVLCRPVVPPGYWDCADNVRGFLELLRSEAHVTSQEDWYRISGEEVGRLHGGSLLKKMTLLDALRIAYPGQRWEERDAPKKSSQRQLFVALSSLLGSDV